MGCHILQAIKVVIVHMDANRQQKILASTAVHFPVSRCKVGTSWRPRYLHIECSNSRRSESVGCAAIANVRQAVIHANVEEKL
jgi:hypothetical protein